MELDEQPIKFHNVLNIVYAIVYLLEYSAYESVKKPQLVVARSVE
jgi:hypothetical protein